VRRVSPHFPNPQELELYLQSVVSPSYASASFETFKSLVIEADLLGFSCPVIVVGGTNGKGSSVKLLQAIYLEAGYRVASFTSPHLFSLTERFQLNAKALSEQDLLLLFQAAFLAIQKNQFNYFQALTYVFFLWMKQISVDVIILEVGLGGRLDPVNVVIPSVTLITNVALDHWQHLGTTREAIAKEKSGLIHENGVLVYGEADMPQSISARIADVFASFYQYGRHYSYVKEKTASHWHFKGEFDYRDLPYPDILIENAVNVLKVIEVLQTRLPVTIQSIEKGLRCEKCLGRGTWVKGIKNYYFDVAHNEAAVCLLAENMRVLKLTNRLIGFGALYQDKLSSSVLLPLLGLFDKLYLVDLGVRFGEDAPALLSQCIAQAGLIGVEILPNLETGWQKALEETTQGEILVTWGSFQTVSFGLQRIMAFV
jgi:dihydrofolate synthase / folylpolyglutamate synthase